MGPAPRLHSFGEGRGNTVDFPSRDLRGHGRGNQNRESGRNRAGTDPEAALADRRTSAQAPMGRTHSKHQAAARSRPRLAPRGWQEMMRTLHSGRKRPQGTKTAQPNTRRAVLFEVAVPGLEPGTFWL